MGTTIIIKDGKPRGKTRTRMDREIQDMWGTTSFRNEEDAAEFAKLLDQTITPRTQSIWYPKAKIDKYMNKRYKSEE